MIVTDNATNQNPAQALYENFMAGEYGKKWDDLPAGVQKRWADALAAGVIAMTSVRIEPFEDFDMEALRAATLQPGTITGLPEPTKVALSGYCETCNSTGKEARHQICRDCDEPTPSAAIKAVLAERQRQVDVEGWTPEHDDKYGKGELLLAAKAYFAHATGRALSLPDGERAGIPFGWPWDKKWWKPKTPRQNLVRAGALALAEIERLKRLYHVRAEHRYVDAEAYYRLIIAELERLDHSALSAQVQDVAGWQDEDKLTPKQAWTILCETPDITSPEEYPDHALITFEQLQSYMERAIVSNGWQVVPKEPTQDMLQRGADSCCSLTIHGAYGVYRAMLAASSAKQEARA